MKKKDRDCVLLCDIQGELFQKSVSDLNMSSETFVRRFMNSNIAEEFDNVFFLEDTKSIKNIFDDLDKQYGSSNYGSVKYSSDVMYWVGYLYRQFAYCYDISSKRAYHYLPLSYVASTYDAYHTLDISLAIERLLEARGISFDPDYLNKKGLELLRKMRLEQKQTN